MNSPDLSKLTDDEVRVIWRAAGGSFHGPNVEHGDMPEALLLPLLRKLLCAADEFRSPCGGCGTEHITCQAWWFDQRKCCPDCTHNHKIPMPDWARLLLECRDALPAISLTSARLRGIDLALATRIEDMLKPWRTDPDNPKAI